MYNQRKQRYTRNACTIYTLLTIMRFNFWIEVKDSFIIKLCKYLEKLWWWLPAQWAVFNIIYALFIKELNKKLGLNFKLKKTTITALKKTDRTTYGVWLPRYNKNFAKAMKNGVITKSEIDSIDTYTWKTFWHNLAWDWSKKGYIINTDWTYPAKCSIETLKYWEKIWVFWNNLRSIIANDKFTKAVIQLTMQMRRYESKWKLDDYLKILDNTEKFEIPWAYEKARELYFYWR